MTISAILVVALYVQGALAYRTFQQEIPNGDHVPHPCQPNFLWHGVGHTNPQGGGARNPFGQDFDAAGKKWTKELCGKDSDGDGRSNGEELGDPRCVWSKGQTPEKTDDISHPGVCDPWNEGQCVGTNSWLDCTRDVEFDCPHIHDPDVRNITLRFPRTKVPAKETTYVCFNFELPSDQEYHLIATKPFIDNANVMHHITMSGCDSTVKLISEPEDCLMGPSGCNDGLAGWTLGMTGDCLNPQAGFRIGKGAATMVSMQHHWTNPGLVDEWFDSSGMVLYYTPKLRKYNAAALTLGQTYLHIPPSQASWVHHGACTSDCTRKIMGGDIHVFTVLNHMHYLGTRQNVTMRRGGAGPMETIIDEDPFSYDTPLHHQYDPPIVVRPGDELTTACTFQSRSRAKTTKMGEGSFDEMCFAFLTYFPAENIAKDQRYCGQWKTYDTCNMYEKCNLAVELNFTRPDVAAMFEKVLTHCDPAGTCQAECPGVLAEVRRDWACIGHMWDYTKDMMFNYGGDQVIFYKLAAAIDSCPGWEDKPATVRPTPATTTKAPAAGPSSMLMELIKNSDARPLLQNIVMNVNYNYGSGYPVKAQTWN